MAVCQVLESKARVVPSPLYASRASGNEFSVNFAAQLDDKGSRDFQLAEQSNQSEGELKRLDNGTWFLPARQMAQKPAPEQGYCEFPLLFRLKDGLFISTPCVADDDGFLDSNQVSHIVAIQDASCHPTTGEIEYQPSSEVDPDGHLRKLNLHWLPTEETRDPLLLKRRLNDLAHIIRFIDEAGSHGGSCLLHSVNGLESAAAAASAYLIVKFRWSSALCLEFLSTRRLRLQLRPESIALLQSAEQQRLFLQTLARSELNHFSEVLLLNLTLGSDAEGHLLHNTFLNAKLVSCARGTIHTVRKARSLGRVLKWRDPINVSPGRQETVDVQRNALGTTISAVLGRQRGQSRQATRPILKRTQSATVSAKDQVSKSAQLPQKGQRPSILGAAIVCSKALLGSHAEPRTKSCGSSTRQQHTHSLATAETASCVKEVEEIEHARACRPSGFRSTGKKGGLSSLSEGWTGEEGNPQLVHSLSRQSTASSAAHFRRKPQCDEQTPKRFKLLQWGSL
ncbi:hypothetical protein Esti_000893 [Eimeria stiedai]